MAKRIQQKRVKGWRKPPNAVYVGRPTKWGNPYKGADIRKFEEWVKCAPEAQLIRDSIGELRGKDLACWCPEGAWCHADVLLEMANTSRNLVKNP
jgi:hypothetical protein